MIFDKLLDKYKNRGSFLFRIEEDFASKCNAPKDSAGVYLIYRCSDNLEKLMYIGSSGQKDRNGNLKIRNGGIYDRLVNGYHPNKFGQEKRIKRKYAFPKHMGQSGVNKICVYWWVTFDSNNSDFPTEVEQKLEVKYLSINDQLPPWHQKG